MVMIQVIVLSFPVVSLKEDHIFTFTRSDFRLPRDGEFQAVIWRL
jgi:hypothetical protein